MLDVSYRADLPDKAIVYMDGRDARVFKQLLNKLGSEERVQNAMILTGLLAQVKEGSVQISESEEKEIRASFKELVGLPFEDFNKLVETI